MMNDFINPLTEVVQKLEAENKKLIAERDEMREALKELLRYSAYHTGQRMRAVADVYRPSDAEAKAEELLKEGE